MGWTGVMSSNSRYRQTRGAFVKVIDFCVVLVDRLNFTATTSRMPGGMIACFSERLG